MVSFIRECFVGWCYRLSTLLDSFAVKRVQEMAETYPTAKFVSVDLKPLTRFVPHRRIEFEVYNFPAGFTCPDASFDFVHARHCVTMVSGFWV